MSIIPIILSESTGVIGSRIRRRRKKYNYSDEFIPELSNVISSHNWKHSRKWKHGRKWSHNRKNEHNE